MLTTCWIPCCYTSIGLMTGHDGGKPVRSHVHLFTFWSRGGHVVAGAAMSRRDVRGKDWIDPPLHGWISIEYKSNPWQTLSASVKPLFLYNPRHPEKNIEGFIDGFSQYCGEWSKVWILDENGGRDCPVLPCFSRKLHGHCGLFSPPACPFCFYRRDVGTRGSSGCQFMSWHSRPY